MSCIPFGIFCIAHCLVLSFSSAFQIGLIRPLLVNTKIHRSLLPVVLQAEKS